jgi:hypothetical protein
MIIKSEAYIFIHKSLESTSILAAVHSSKTKELGSIPSQLFLQITHGCPAKLLAQRRNFNN